jgi:Flp pilus assembly protein TadG
MLEETKKNSESGVATIEFAVTASFFLLMIVSVVAGGHFFWTHNAIVEATRRGARYAASQCNPSDTNCPGRAAALGNIQNVVLYGSPDTPTTGTETLVPDLRASQIVVTYSPRTGMNDSEAFGVAQGTVSVKIQGFNYNFLSAVTLPMPPYETTVRGESAGYQAAQNICP